MSILVDTVNHMLPAHMYSTRGCECPEECCPEELYVRWFITSHTRINAHHLQHAHTHGTESPYSWGHVCIPFANLNKPESITLLIFLLHMFTLIQLRMQWQVRQEWQGVSAGAWHAIQTKQYTALSCSHFVITVWFAFSIHTGHKS